jgi:hypothetical protein
MGTCEACLKPISAEVAQCPYCLSKQVGSILKTPMPLSNSPNEGQQNSQVIGVSRLDSDAKWASDVLDTLGDSVRGSEVLQQLDSLVEERLADFLKPGVRWWWHSLSTLIWLLGFGLLVGGAGDLGVLVWALWPLSLISHALSATKHLQAREPQKQEAGRRLKGALEIKVQEREQRLYEKDRKKSEEWRRKDREAQESREREKLQRQIMAGVVPASRPRPQPLGVSPDGAEKLCANWMEHLGQTNVRVTRSNSDGGIDIESDEWVAQVKNYKGSVSVMEIRELVGVSSIDRRAPVFFTSGRYTASALDFAETAAVLLFSYNAEKGTLTAESALARALL